MDSQLEGVDPSIDEWVRQNEELVEEHDEELATLAQLAACSQLENTAEKMADESESEEVKRLAARMKMEVEIGRELSTGNDPIEALA